MKHVFACLLFVLLHFFSEAQELFPLSEPASTMSKGVWGIRTNVEYYDQGGTARYMAATRLLYGLTPKLTGIISIVGSNHHAKEMQEGFWVDHPKNGKHPFLLNGGHLYFKYRFVTIDNQNSHFRIAAYAEGSLIRAHHDEAEPDLFDDNSGYGAGWISTYLNKRFAASFTGGFIKPATYNGRIKDPLPGLPHVPLRIEYRPSYIFDLSFGYLLFPRKYKSYSQTNWNLYLEFKGKHYPTIDIYVGHPVQSSSDPSDFYQIFPRGDVPYLRPGTYVDLNYGLQCIIHSNLRIDFSIGTPFINRGFAREYPYFQIGLQRYFY